MTESQTVEQRIQQLDPQALSSVNQYIDELKGEAQGDYDFIVKFLKRQFESALGTDDVAKAQFLANVSNQLEKRIGQIPYDYELLTGREKENIAANLRVLDVKDTDLRAREKELEQQTAFETQLEKEQRQQEFNQRGLLGSGLEKKRAQQQEQARRLSLTPQERALELEGTMLGEQRAQTQLESTRRLEDLTTQARRAALGEQQSFEKGSEGAQRSLEQRLAEIRRTGQAEKRAVLGGLQQEELLKRQTATFA